MKIVITLVCVLVMAGSVLAFQVPEDGIWKSENGKVSFMLQTYVSGSCVIILSNGVNTAVFLDQDGPNETNGAIDAFAIGGISYQFHLWGINETGSDGFVFSSHPKMLMFPEPFYLELPAN